MRTLFEIIEAVKTNSEATMEELEYAVLALNALTTFDSLAFLKLSEAETLGKKAFLTHSANWQWKESYNRTKTALGTSPKAWVGWNNDPKNPEYQKRRETGMKLLKKVEDQCQKELKPA